MLPKEIKKLVDVSEGKVILSEGNINKSYVVMKLNKYLEEKNVVTEERHKGTRLKEKANKLTDDFFLDKINVDIEAIREEEREKKLKNDFLVENNINNEFDYDYSSEK